MPTQNRSGHQDGTLANCVERKLPQVTLLFWTMKTVAVTLGETAGDLLGITFKLGYLATGAFFLAFFLVTVTAQIRAGRFRPVLYWAVVLGTSMVGTEISDLMNRGLGHGSAPAGLGYAWGAVVLTAALALVFAAWWLTGQTYDVESITGRQGETLYWIAILVSNTLGTSSGDWLSDDTGLGFRNEFLVITALMAVITAAHYLTPVSGTLLFWLAFVLTRPLGAAGGDSLTKPVTDGGLGWGTAWASAALCATLAALVAHQTRHLRTHPLPSLPSPARPYHPPPNPPEPLPDQTPA
jgi:uncharacterized membrane-anchored protein